MKILKTLCILLSTVSLLSCGGASNKLSQTAGSIIITAGASITFDMSDVMALDPALDYSIVLKRPADNYKATTTLLDLTQLIQSTPSTDNTYTYILPKELAGISPIIVEVTIPSIKADMTDVIFSDTRYVKPGIASTLTYQLLQFFPGKKFSDFSSFDYNGIKNLVTTQVDQIHAQTERLDYATIRYDRLMRFFKNGFAFNPTFLTAVRDFGINYGFTMATIPGLQAIDTPENSLDSYQYATNFTVGGVAVANYPMNELNNIPQLGMASPGVGWRIFAREGDHISVQVSAVDIDNDFIDKSMIVQYVPRILPRYLPNGIDPNNLPKPEATPNYETYVHISGPEAADTYQSPKIQYSEALDLSMYQKCILGVCTPCDPADTNPDCGDTAYRNIYYLVSDGMMMIPFHWNFRYADVNRGPKIIRTSQNAVNQTTIDTLSVSQIPSVVLSSGKDYGTLALKDISPVPPVLDPNIFYQHASHCETNPNDVTQAVHAKSDGPWSCAFAVYDPDVDDDPNAAMDNFYYSLANYEPSTEIFVNGSQLSPTMQLQPTTSGALLPHCVDSSGVTHLRCGLGLYSITVDNSVKISSATKTSSTFNYDVVVTDRPTGGFTDTQTISRVIKFTPIPARLVNFSDVNSPPGALQINTEYGPSDPYVQAGTLINGIQTQTGVYKRKEIYLNEILALSNFPTGANPEAAGFHSNGFDNGNGFQGNGVNPNPRHPIFNFTVNGTAINMSPYFTQPRMVQVSLPTFDVNGLPASIPPAAIPILLGNLLNSTIPGGTNPDPFGKPYTIAYPVGGSLFPPNLVDPTTSENYDALMTYSHPRQFDNICALNQNNAGPDVGGKIWDQRNYNSAPNAGGGWTFEIDAVDLDNVALRVSEPYEPVYLSVASDDNKEITYCNYNSPYTYTPTFDTYNSTTTGGVTKPSVDSEFCNWKGSAQSVMQPVSVFYTDKDGALKKMVYHRLRVQWRPRDNDNPENLDASLNPLPSAVRALLTSIKLYGDTNKNAVDPNSLDAIQDEALYSPSDPILPDNLLLGAERKDMQSCIGLINPTVASMASAIVNDVFTTPADFTFHVFDSNRRNEGSTTNVLPGVYEAEVVMNGYNDSDMLTNGISGTDFVRFAPFIRNCGHLAVANPDPKPMLWYAGPDKRPRTRLYTVNYNHGQAQSDTNEFCIRSGYQAYQEASTSRIFDKAALYTGTGLTVPTVVDMTQFTDAAGKPCFPGQTAPITVDNNSISYLMTATSCPASSFASDPNWQVFDFSPSAPQNGSIFTSAIPNPLLSFKLFPQFYGADVKSGVFSANALRLDIYGIDTFILDPTTHLDKALVTDSINSPYSPWIDTTNTQAHMSTMLTQFGPAQAGYLLGFVDRDHQPTSFTLADTTPTPSPTASMISFYHISSSGLIEGFAKGANGVSGATGVTLNIPIRIMDHNLPTTLLENDPYDIYQYLPLTVALGGATASAAPSWDGTRFRQSSDCLGTPSFDSAPIPGATPVFPGSTFAFPGNVTTPNFIYSVFEDFRKCTFSWTPAAADVGNKYTYNFNVQDNPSGAGGIHPLGVASPPLGLIIPSDSDPISNGPLSPFSVTFQSIETNLAPYFVNSVNCGSGACQNQNIYTTTDNSANDWKKAFGGTGLQFSTCTAASGFSCAAIPGPTPIQANDMLLTNGGLPFVLTEGAAASFSVSAQDDNITASMKTLIGTPPRSVLVLNKTAGTYSEYSVPQWTTLAFGNTGSTTQTTNFTFSWTPNDLEAFYLSNTDGFLIPVVIQDKGYTASTDADFPSSFIVPPLKRTIWIWATLQVANASPTVVYLNPGELPLAGANLLFQTGQSTVYTLRIKDTDTARFTAGGNTSPFIVDYANTPSLFASPASTPGPVMNLSGNYLTQDFKISTTTLTSADIGTYGVRLIIKDPGDPSKGLAASPSSGDATIASAPDVPIVFSITVVGKPFFVVPNTGTGQNWAHVFVNNINPTPFSYPMSISISRPTDLTATFFMGIDQSQASTIPMKTTAGGTGGMYVNQDYVLKWPDTPFLDSHGNPMAGQRFTVPIYAVSQADCGSGSNLTLVRYNESTGTIQTCALSTAKVTADAANETMNLRVLANNQLSPLPSPSAYEADRVVTGVDTSAQEQAAITHFAEFKGHCVNCSILDTVTGVSSNPNGANNLVIAPNQSTGSVSYKTSTGFANSLNFQYATDTSGNYTITKKYGDVNPTYVPLKSISLSATKGESLSFTGTLTAAPNPSPAPASAYRWYVNGCLKQAGMITSNTITFNYKLGILSSGLNNGCVGQFSINETGANKLGQVLVRLSIYNNIEAIATTATPAPTTDGATVTYLWKINVLNNAPSLQSATPLALTYTGNQSIGLALPVTLSGTDYLAYTDLTNGTSTKVHLRAFQYDGSLLSTGPDAASSLTSQATTLGIQPTAQPILTLSTLSASSYPAPAAAMSFFQATTTAFGANLIGSTFTNWTSAYWDQIAAYSVFSRYFLSSTPSAWFSTDQNLYDHSTTEKANFYLIDGVAGYKSSTQYWTKNINTAPSIYTSASAPFSDPTRQGVRKNIVAGTNTLIQFVGAKNLPSSTTSGSLWISTLAPATNPDNLKATVLQTMNFTTSSPGVGDCNFSGTPLDGQYVSTTDTLFVLAASNNGGGGGIMAVKGATSGSATCTILTTATANPSLNSSEFNPNLMKSVFDTNSGYIYGLIAKTGGAAGQIYYIDTYTNQVFLQDLPTGITPSALIYSKTQNAVLLMDGDKSTSPVKAPTLYRIW